LAIGQLTDGKEKQVLGLCIRSTLVVTYPILNIAEFSACEAALEWFVRVWRWVSHGCGLCALSLSLTLLLSRSIRFGVSKTLPITVTA